jgi:hypothetical protein
LWTINILLARTNQRGVIVIEPLDMDDVTNDGSLTSGIDRETIPQIERGQGTTLPPASS